VASRLGSPNKNKKFLLKKLQEMYGESFDPIMKIAEIASKVENDESLKLAAWKEIAQYVYPKLKSIEVTGDSDNPLVTSVQIELIKPAN